MGKIEACCDNGKVEGNKGHEKKPKRYDGSLDTLAKWWNICIRNN